MLTPEIRQQAADSLYQADTQRHLIPQLSRSYEGIELAFVMGQDLSGSGSRLPITPLRAR